MTTPVTCSMVASLGMQAERPSSGLSSMTSAMPMIEPGRRHDLGERGHGRAMEVKDALGLVADHQRALARPILRRDAGRAAIGMAGLGLDAAEREHEAARRIAPVGAERHHARDVEGAEDLAARADLDAV